MSTKNVCDISDLEARRERAKGIRDAVDIPDVSNTGMIAGGVLGATVFGGGIALLRDTPGSAPKPVKYALAGVAALIGGGFSAMLGGAISQGNTPGFDKALGRRYDAQMKIQAFDELIAACRGGTSVQP